MLRSKQRVIVLGLDGATWTLLGPWIEAGRLPNLARLMAQGVHGDLRSTVPPYTAPAWTSFATGKGPGKHGIVDFWRFSWDTHNRSPIDAQRVWPATFWSILSRNGLRVGVVNVPITYPPYSVNGIMISGMLTPSEDADYTFPRLLKTEIRSAVGDYAANPYASVSQTSAFLMRVAYWIRQRERANQYLLSTCGFDCFVNVIQAPDPIQHQFWKLLDPNHPLFDEQEAAHFRPYILECYRAVDEVVGRRMDMLDSHTQLFVLSDHGFGPAQKYFNVNRFLAGLGLLVLQNQTDGERSLGALRKSMISWAGKVVRRADVLGLRHRLLDNRQREALRHHLDRAVTHPIDWSCTQAYFASLTSESIYVRVRGRDAGGLVEPGAEYEALRDRVIRALLDVRDPETGEAVVADAYRREEVYNGSRLEELPDIVFSLGKRPYLPSEQLAPSAIVQDLPAEAGGGRHQPNGIFLAAGAGIRRNTVLEGAQIVDLAPTILYALGVPVPQDMDGRVLTEAFDPEFVGTHPVQFGLPTPVDDVRAGPVYTADEADAIESHLRDLGYLE